MNPAGGNPISKMKYRMYNGTHHRELQAGMSAFGDIWSLYLWHGMLQICKYPNIQANTHVRTGVRCRNKAISFCGLWGKIVTKGCFQEDCGNGGNRSFGETWACVQSSDLPSPWCDLVTYIMRALISSPRKRL